MSAPSEQRKGPGRGTGAIPEQRIADTLNGTADLRQSATCAENTSDVYAAYGFDVIPLHGVQNGVCSCGNAACKSAGKHPIETGWTTAAPRPYADIQTAYLHANIGIRTGSRSHVFVLDIDTDNGKRGANSLERLEEKYGRLPDTLEVCTGGGGRHLYFKMPDFSIGLAYGELLEFPGIDVRGDRGLVVAPPSVSHKGPYKIVVDTEPVDAPQWLLGILRKANENSSTLGLITDYPEEDPPNRALPDSIVNKLAESVSIGNRSELFHAITNMMRRAGFTAGNALAILSDWCISNGNLYSGRVSREIVRSWEQGIRSDRTTGKSVDPTIEELFSARPVLQHIMEFARSRLTAPTAVLGSVLARVVAATPYWVKLPPTVGSFASLNLFIGIVGKSGNGKGASERVAEECLTFSDDNRGKIALTPQGFEVLPLGSGEGIAHGYAKRQKNDEIVRIANSVLFTCAEVDTLGALKGRSGSTVLPELRKAWVGEGLGFQYADSTKRLPITQHSYRLCLVTGIQPNRAQVLLSDADGGTPQRFVWLPATDSLAPDVAPETPNPRPWKLPELASESLILPICDTARIVIQAERLKDLRGQNGSELDSHENLARLKVAAALGLLDERTDVSEEDWRLAGLVMEISKATRDSIQATLRESADGQNRQRAEDEAKREIIKDCHTTEHQVKRIAQRVKQHVQNAGRLSHSDARKKVNRRDREFFEDAIERLVQAGEIAEESNGNARYYTYTR